MPDLHKYHVYIAFKDDLRGAKIIVSDELKELMQDIGHNIVMESDSAVVHIKIKEKTNAGD